MRSLRIAAATRLPVLPQLTAAIASPFFTSSMARIIEESFLRRMASSGLSSIVMTSEAWLSRQRRMAGEPRPGQQGLQHRRVAHQDERTEARVFRQGQAGGLDDLGRAEIAAHGVHGNAAGGGRVCHRLEKRAGRQESPA